MHELPADARVLEGFDFDDLDDASLAGYRERFAASKPEHPWLVLDTKTLLGHLGCWRKDRHKGKYGLTLAGLLMFGKHEGIITPGAASSYLVDYRDYRKQQTPRDQWSDRLFPDGTWEANLFQFCQRCWPKLIADLKVPSPAKSAQRSDETSVHIALREAFVNALVHTDYDAPGGIVIERYRERYRMENPGTLLVSEEQLRRGGVSQCRNIASAHVHADRGRRPGRIGLPAHSGRLVEPTLAGAASDHAGTAGSRPARLHHAESRARTPFRDGRGTAWSILATTVATPAMDNRRLRCRSSLSDRLSARTASPAQAPNILEEIAIG
jgi:hypothetical protein